jgi:hypothetical protein
MKEYFDQCDYERKKQSLKLLSRMTMTTDFDTAIEAFEEGFKLEPDKHLGGLLPLNNRNFTRTGSQTPQHSSGT